MEELLILVLHFIFELVWNLLTWFPFDLILGRRERKRATEGSALWPGEVVIVASALVGAALGGVSLWVWPHVLVKYSWLRLLNLALTPALAGWFASKMSRARREHGEPSEDKVHIWSAVLFTLLYAAIRFVWASRGNPLGSP